MLVLAPTWTIVLLTGPGIVGMPEVTDKVEGRMTTRGPFSLVRHPTYLSHTMMLLGVFLLTGVAAVGIVALIDVLVINIIVTSRMELAARFGAEMKIPGGTRFLPWKLRP
jgi:protein-S-isoprenylcysteine O-methyltransferase Ste14